MQKPHAERTRHRPALKQPPTAYVVTAKQFQCRPGSCTGWPCRSHSLRLDGPWCFTPGALCVRGRGERHTTYQDARDALRRYLKAGVTNVDCRVAMQVNWHWHSDMLQSVEQALDPYPNPGHRRGHLARPLPGHGPGGEQPSACITPVRWTRSRSARDWPITRKACSGGSQAHSVVWTRSSQQLRQQGHAMLERRETARIALHGRRSDARVARPCLPGQIMCPAQRWKC